MEPVQIDDKDLRKLFHTKTPLSKLTLLVWRTLKHLFYIALLFVFFFYLLNFGAFWQQFKYSVTSHPSTPVKVAPIVQAAPTAPPPNYAPEIYIPKIGITAPIVMNIPLAGVHADLEEGVVQVQGSALPGQIGNVVIFGHSSDYIWNPGIYRNIFALLDKLSVGDQIAVPYGSQRFIYQVTKSQVVSPTDISVIEKTNQPVLTLITCYPTGTSTYRLIITATLVSGQITGSQTSSPVGSTIPVVH